MDFDYLIDKKYDGLLAYHQKSHRGYTTSTDSMSGRTCLSFLYKTGEYGYTSARGCYQGLQQHVNEQIVTVMVSVLFYKAAAWHTLDELAVERRFILDYLVNRSPFKDIYLSKDPDKILKDRVLYAHTQVPQNVLAAGLICSRYAWEHQNISYMFYHLCKVGLNEHMAFLVAQLCRIFNKDEFELSHCQNYHTAMVPALWTSKEVLGYINGVFLQPRSTTYYTSSEYNHVDALFSKDSGMNVTVRDGLTQPTVSDCLWNKMKIALTDNSEASRAPVNNPFKGMGDGGRQKHPMYKYRKLTQENIQVVADAATWVLKEIA